MRSQVGRAFEFSGSEAPDSCGDGRADQFDLVGAGDGGDDGVDAAKGVFEGFVVGVVDDRDLRASFG